MLKLFGGVLVISACFGVGATVSHLETLALRETEAFLSLISHIRSEITAFRRPLSDIFASYRDPVLSACGFLENATKTNAEQAFSECRARLFLASDEENILSSFFAGLGKRSAGEEKNACLVCEEKLSHLISARRASLPKKKSLSCTIGTLVGILAAILLF